MSKLSKSLSNYLPVIKNVLLWYSGNFLKKFLRAA